MATMWKPVAAIMLALVATGCSQGGVDGNAAGSASEAGRVATVATANGPHRFRIERATTPAEQQRGLMYRTDLKSDDGMLFYPYPAEGGAPRVASFWMKNTPTPLDILFIRADGTIATIAENTIPFSEAPVSSREPVAAVLELVGGRSAELGIAEGDTVTWAK